ncbi:MAG: hypothetical protein COA94_07615 [Rickettsiales bacterium]|nr:MAG: hypothetical protein COA94_07615 [Rickettsiales bacterium]
MFRVFLIIIALITIILIASGSVPQLSMLAWIKDVFFSAARLIFSIVRGVWPLLILAACGYLLIKKSR